VWTNCCKASDGSATVKVKEQLANFSMNVMTRMLLGKRFFGHKAAGAAEAAEFLDITEGIFLFLGVINIADYVPFLRPFDLQGYEARMRHLCARMDAFHSAILEEHRAKKRARESSSSSSSSNPDGHQQAQTNEDEKEEADPRHDEDFVDILLSLPGFNGEPHLEDVEMKALIQVNSTLVWV
jgi:hypothetical protein